LEAERASQSVFERPEDLYCRRSFWNIIHDRFNVLINLEREGIRMSEYRIKVAPNTVAYADAENRTLIVEFAIPGAPTDTIDVKILEDSVHLTAPARNVEYVSALALGWPVKPAKAEATYEHGLLRIEVPFKDPMEDAVKVAIKASAPEPKAKIAGS
jgi:HSP20 family molecular chaperone IbpA